MPQTAKLIGAPGSGKTHRLLELMDVNIAEGYSPLTDIAFVSFTRAARREAAERAAAQFSVPRADLEVHGHFRTLHSICFQGLGLMRQHVLTRDHSQWLSDTLQMRVAKAATPDDPRRDSEFPDAGDRGAGDDVLLLWSAARNMLVPLDVVWRKVRAIDDDIPPLAKCRAAVLRYEGAKYVEGRLDFTDMLGRWGGIKFGVDGHTAAEPEGDVPGVAVVFHDEAQDASRLTLEAFRRLTSNPRCRRVYIAGDPRQCLYGWAGTAPENFLDWPCEKQQAMTKSWRCPRPVLDAADRVLRQSSCYLHYGVAPADHEGSVEEEVDAPVSDIVDPRKDWLVLCRTNRRAGGVGKALTDAGIPWAPLRGRGGWRSRKVVPLAALSELQVGSPLSGEQVVAIARAVPSVVDGRRMWGKGYRDWTMYDYDPTDDDWVTPNELSTRFGVTESLLATVESGSWDKVVSEGREFAPGVKRHGPGLATAPMVRVGTVHAAKGMQADNVLVVCAATRTVWRAMQTQGGFDEECRVAYTAMTRARRRLVIDRTKRRFAMPL